MFWFHCMIGSTDAVTLHGAALLPTIRQIVNANGGFGSGDSF